MADYDSRPRGARGGYNNRKRRYRDEDDYDRRPQRRRYEDPPGVKLRKQLLSLAESPLRRVEDEILSIARSVRDSAAAAAADDTGAESSSSSFVREEFLQLALQLIIEQPFKIPFVAAVVLVLNALKDTSPRGENAEGEGDGGDVQMEGESAEREKIKREVGVEIAREVVKRAAQGMNDSMKAGSWREVKLYLKFLGALQGMLSGEGVFPVLEDVLGKAVDLQTENNEETIGPELVKIILFTIPYIMASSSTDSHDKAASMVENTDIIAGEPHVLQALVDPYPGDGKTEATIPDGVLALLQKQLQAEAAAGWPLDCLARPWKVLLEIDSEALSSATKHDLPAINIPEVVTPGPRALFPELYFSVYANQELETVPPTSSIASCLLRDALVDTINVLDYNRNAASRFLIDLDCYFAPGTFVKRATPFDRLRDIEDGRSTWKPEDVAVDAVFSQLFQLPAPEHKLVYYHSVLTEACKIAPAAIAPSLGRAIRFLYRNIDSMDLDLSYRFMDWFAHHLSNFGFTWKWTEWIDDVGLPSLEPKKAFIQGALDKEIRLSFAQRIKGTLPAPYQALITEEKEKDTPDFKYNDESIPFSHEGKEIMTLIRKKAPEDDVQPLIDQIHTQATDMHLDDPIAISTDAYVTAICYVGSKSLSHVLSCIERCKERLLSIGTVSPSTGRKQIIDSVMDYWRHQPGVGVNIVDKLLNYTILSPGSVIDWALGRYGTRLAEPFVFEMVAATVGKVTTRVRQVVTQTQANARGLPEEQAAVLKQAADAERASMRELFQGMEDSLTAWASGAKDQQVESGDMSSEDAMVRQWGQRWLRVFRRRFAVEEAWYLEAVKETVDGMDVDGNGEGAKKEENGDENLNLGIE